MLHQFGKAFPHFASQENLITSSNVLPVHFELYTIYGLRLVLWGHIVNYLLIHLSQTLLVSFKPSKA